MHAARADVPARARDRIIRDTKMHPRSGCAIIRRNTRIHSDLLQRMINLRYAVGSIFFRYLPVHDAL